jgi:hypothetical protein
MKKYILNAMALLLAVITSLSFSYHYSSVGVYTFTGNYSYELGDVSKWSTDTNFDCIYPGMPTVCTVFTPYWNFDEFRTLIDIYRPNSVYEVNNLPWVFVLTTKEEPE